MGMDAEHERRARLMMVWLKKPVRQFTAGPLYQHHIGRESVVVEAMCDEHGLVHCKTADGIWCPASLLRFLKHEDTVAALAVHREVKP